MRGSPRCLVVGVDGSAESHEALRWSSRLATQLDARVVVVHALDLLEDLGGETVDVDHEECDKVRELVEQQWCAGIRGAARIVVRSGSPVDVLAAVAIEEAAATLIVGSHGVGAAPAFALGSTAFRLLRLAPVPVLVVPRREESAGHLAMYRILVGIDGVRLPTQAVELARDLAVAFGAQVELVNVNEDGTAGPLATVRDWIGGPGVPVHVSVERGKPDEVVRAIAARIDADLVVLSTGHRGDADDRHLDTAVTHKIARIIHRPFLVVPEGGLLRC